MIAFCRISGDNELSGFLRPQESQALVEKSPGAFCYPSHLLGKPA